MTTKAKVLTGLVLSTVLATGAFAACDSKGKYGMKDGNHHGKMMMKSHYGKKGFMQMRSIMKQLNLSAEQKTEIKKIFTEARAEKQTLNDAFTKSTFDKQKFIKIMSEKRDNMIKSKANMIEKVYSVLDSKQKEQFKTLLELKTQKMQSRFNNKG